MGFNSGFKGLKCT